MIFRFSLSLSTQSGPPFSLSLSLTFFDFLLWTGFKHLFEGCSRKARLQRMWPVCICNQGKMTELKVFLLRLQCQFHLTQWIHWTKSMIAWFHKPGSFSSTVCSKNVFYSSFPDIRISMLKLKEFSMKRFRLFWKYNTKQPTKKPN